MFPLGVAVGWPRLIVLFLICVALLAIGAAIPIRDGWWTAAGVAIAVTIVALVTWRGAPLVSLLARLIRLRSAGRRAAITSGVTPPSDHHRSFEQCPVGIRAVGPHLVAVVAVDGPPHSPSVLDRHRVESFAALPIDVVAAGLQQFDVTLEGIDVVSVGVRRAPKAHHHYAPVYSGMVGDHPAIGQRRTWLVVRFNAPQSVAAIVCRESVAATLGAAAERLARELTSLRCPARVLSADQIAEVDEALLAGADPAALRSGWGRLRHRGGYISTYWLSPHDISTANISQLWAPDTDATVVTVQLRRTPTGAATVGALARYHTGGRLREAPLTGLNPFTARHDLGFAAGLAAVGSARATVPSRPLADGEQLTAPVGSTGIIIGTTRAGHPLLLDLATAAGTSSMTIAGEVALAMQVALRAAATGYQVVVHSTRPRRWQQAIATGLQLVGPDRQAEESPPSARPRMVVYDHVSGPVPAGVNVVVRTVDAGTASGADIHIEQDSPGHAVVRTWAFQYRLQLDLDHERRLTAPGPPRAA